MASVALNLIVKNGGQGVIDAIRSSLVLVDAVYVHDTGSTDDTFELQAEYLPSLAVPWNLTQERAFNGFSEPRNKLLDTTLEEWALVLDADEKAICAVTKVDGLLPESWIKQKLNRLDVPIKVDVWNIIKDERHPIAGIRIVPVNAGYRYVRKAHNLLVGPDGLPVTKLVQCPPWFNVEHYGYTPDLLGDKAARTVALLMQDLEELPEQAGLTHFYLWRELQRLNHVDAAMHHGQLALEWKGPDVWRGLYMPLLEGASV